MPMQTSVITGVVQVILALASNFGSRFLTLNREILLSLLFSTCQKGGNRIKSRMLREKLEIPRTCIFKNFAQIPGYRFSKSFHVQKLMQIDALVIS